MKLVTFSNVYEDGFAVEDHGERVEVVVTHLPERAKIFTIASVTLDADGNADIHTLFQVPLS